MARRLALVGVFVMIEQGSMIQLILGTTFSAAYMLIQMQTGPCTWQRSTPSYVARALRDRLSRRRRVDVR
jgi:hypothetical protein